MPFYKNILFLTRIKDFYQIFSICLEWLNINRFNVVLIQTLELSHRKVEKENPKVTLKMRKRPVVTKHLPI